VGPALSKVLQRYARALKITLKDLQAALQGALHGDVDTWDEAWPADSAETQAAPLQGSAR